MKWFAGRRLTSEPRRRARSRVPVVCLVLVLLVPAAMELMATAAGAAAGDIDTAAGTGTPGYNGDGETALLAQLNGPAGLATDSQGNTIVGDAANSRIRVIAESATNPGYPLAGCIGACSWSPG